MVEIRRYVAQSQQEWNDFVSNSKNGTFLFDRNYMDYHSDRFADHSLLVYRNNKIYALFPANEDGDCIFSHQGLTYGGLITNGKATTKDVCDVFLNINSYYREKGFKKVVYKPLPHIYHHIPAEEDLYVLVNTCQAHLICRHISSCLPAHYRPTFIESRRSGMRKATQQDVLIEESKDFRDFWKILTANLACRYHSVPTHSLTEITQLANRFPDKIRLFRACKTSLLAGVVIYDCDTVVHVQYIAASPEGKHCGALDLLFHHLLNNVFPDRCFDFGKSSDGDGHDLNTSLIFQKEGFGGRGICYDWYEYDL